jgi:hypothetical protein
LPAAGIVDLLWAPIARHVLGPVLASRSRALGERNQLATHTFQVGAHGMKYSSCGWILVS